MTAFLVEIEHPDAERILRAAITGYANLAAAHAEYSQASQPRASEGTRGRARRVAAYNERAQACRQATIKPATDGPANGDHPK